MKHLGKYLLENGIVTAEQLEEALQSQVAFGGRLGTNLVELGFLSLEDLQGHLAAHTGIPAPPREWLETPGIEAVQAVPLELVKQHKVLPLQLERDKRTLHVGMVDPLDPRKTDELGFATGFRVKAYILAEATAYHWLDYHYDIPREIRHLDLSGREVRDPEEEAWERRQRAPEPAPLKEEAQALGIEHLEAGEELVGETTFSELHSGMVARMDAMRDAREARAARSESPTPETATPAPPPASDETTAPVTPPPAPHGAGRIGTLEATLGAATERSAVVSAALDLAAEFAQAAALFLVRGQTIEGVDGRGEKLGSRVGSVVLPREGSSRFAEATAGRQPLRTTTTPGGVDARLLAALGRGDAREFALVPVEIRGRVVNLLYADNGSDSLGPVAFAALRALSLELSAAYERLILEQKRQIG